MDRLVSSRRFALADLLIVLGCGAIWLVYPAAGGWPILIALLPWAARLAAGRFPFQKSILDLPILAFLLTAGVGVWVAYDHEFALAKFWILISAVLVYYAIAGQPKANMGVVTGLFGGLGGFIAILFLLSQDWSKPGSTDFGGLDRIGQWIMGIRPDFPMMDLPPNQVGGLLILLFPFALAFLFNSWKNGRRRLVAIAIFSAAGMLLGLLLTSSRGSWLALAAGVGVWLLWWLSERLAGGEIKKAGIYWGLVMVGLGIVGLVGIMLYPGGALGILDRLPGLPDGESRLELAQSALDLIGDYPLTGSGLRSFPGSYSQYIMVSPFLLFEYSHNFMLDIAVEQGVFGWLTILLICGLSAFLLVKFIMVSRRESRLRVIAEACLASLVAVGIHGLVDDALYSNTATPFLFLLPGMAVGLSKLKGIQPIIIKGERNYQKWLVLGAATFVMIGLAVIVWRKPLLGAWQANLGAVSMSQYELAGWPTNRWNANPDVSALGPARVRFQQAVKIDPVNRTAHHRLGLIALQSREFQEAIDQLFEAYRIDSKHRGIQKALGYAYVWVGNYDQAAQLLAKFPEAEYELNQYVIWWKSLKRNDLAKQAQQMEEILKVTNTRNLIQRENQP